MKDERASVTLRAITRENWKECIRLRVTEDQEDFVAPNLYSIAESKVNTLLVPLAIYDAAIRGREPGPEDPMVGFAMYQVMDGVGFLTRLMVDARYQGRGYGRATVLEVIRRLKLTPEIEVIGTSFARRNQHAERLYRSLGFKDHGRADAEEIVLLLDWEPERQN